MVLASPAAMPAALADATTQIGNATITAGGGTAILTLPDVKFQKVLAPTQLQTIGEVKNGKDFGDEIGWNINGAIAVPLNGMSGRPKWLTLSGFWANIEDDDTASCTRVAGVNDCAHFTLVDTPGVVNRIVGGLNSTQVGDSSRDVDHWGVSLESKWLISGGGETYKGAAAPTPRYFAIGADVRGIYQDFDLTITQNNIPAEVFTYTEDLDTTYYGAYAAIGGDIRPFLLKNFWERHGLQSSFMLRGGVYYADADYSGRTNSALFPANMNSALSLSEDDVAFIGGIVLETRKKIGARTTLSLRSEYEYYSWVPEMNYLDNDNGGLVTGPNTVTSIGDDDAFSARSMLRLTVSLGGPAN